MINPLPVAAARWRSLVRRKASIVCPKSPSVLPGQLRGANTLEATSDRPPRTRAPGRRGTKDGGEAGGSPSIAEKRVLSSPRPIGHDWVYSAVAVTPAPSIPAATAVPRIAT